MNFSRRDFLGIAGSAVLARTVPAQTRTREALFRIGDLKKFVEPLTIPARAKPLRESKDEAIYRVEMRQFQAKCHPDMPATTFWGYDGMCPGPTFNVRRGQAIQVEWLNQLPERHLFTVDHTLCGAGAGKPQVRTVVHLHGGKVAPENDGYPERWIVSGDRATTHYPNQQDATALFYHDHAMGITRLNAVAGLMGLYLLRDEHEDSLQLPAGDFEIPLVLFDRSFLPDGDIFYPVSGHPDMPWVSEYYGGGILVNGKLFPFLDLQPRTYRFRMLNPSNGGFYRIAIARDYPVNSPAHEMFLIGGDQGFHREPASVQEFILGPGERADVLVDFAPFAGAKAYLRTGFAGIMEFRVGSGSVKGGAILPKSLKRIDQTPESSAVKTRLLTLGDNQDRLGRSHKMLLNATPWAMPATEKPVLNSTEIWQLINLTDDSHPIHLHLVRFQVLERRPFDLNTYTLTGKIVYSGPPDDLEPSETGWKDTVRVDPNTIVRIIVKFEGYTGRYVWHCHMLEHEDNEMMRPFEVLLA